MLDGPQGLARVGCRIRSSERSLAAAGKTADIRPLLTQPYGGFTVLVLLSYVIGPTPMELQSGWAQL